MNNFWSNVCAGTVGAVFSAAAIAAIGELRPLGLQLIIPEDAVIPMSGECPPGWRRYQAADGQYIVTPASGLSVGSNRTPPGESHSATAPVPGQADQTAIDSSPGMRLVVPRTSTYIILSLCQRR
jgi:hypothetical protein